MNFLSVLKLVLQLLPLILQTIKEVEASSPLSGSGAAKMELVKGLLVNTVDIGTDIDKNQYGVAIEKVITLAVNFFNKTGTFSKGA